MYSKSFFFISRTFQQLNRRDDNTEEVPPVPHIRYHHLPCAGPARQCCPGSDLNLLDFDTPQIARTIAITLC